MTSKLVGDKVILELDLDNIDENLLSYLSALEISSKSKASEENIHELSEEITKKWWKLNKNKLVDENSR